MDICIPPKTFNIKGVAKCRTVINITRTCTIFCYNFVIIAFLILLYNIFINFESAQCSGGSWVQK